MDHDKNEKNVTVQGRDTPVPVRGSSGRAGSPGPSARDRSVSPAGSQTGDDYKDTGICGSAMGEDCINPFSRSRRIARTPPQSRGRVNSLPDRMEKMITVDLCKDSTIESEGEDRPMKKRKAEMTPLVTTGRITQTTDYVINRVYSKVADLITFCKQNTNVHREIKKTATELGAMMERVLAEISKRDTVDGEMEEENRALRSRVTQTEAKAKEKYDALRKEVEAPKAKQGERREMVTDEAFNTVGSKTSMVSVGTQTERRDPTLKTNNMITREQVDSVTDFKGLKEILGVPWHPRVYREAFLASGTPLKADRDAELVILVEESHSVSTGNTTLYNAFVQRYPTLNDMEGKMSAMEVNITTEDRNGRRTTTEKTVYRAEIDNTPEDWYKTIKALGEKIAKRSKKKLVLYPPSYDKGGNDTRKITEWILRNSDIKCMIYPGENDERGTRSANRTEGPERKKSKALIIQQEEGKSYTDILKKIKENVKADSNAASGIKKIRRIRDGNMIIVLEEREKEAILELKQQIGKDFKVKQVGGEDKLAKVYMKDIDGITTREEVCDAIARETGVVHDQIQVSELRPFFGGIQAATVNLARKFADALVRKGKMRIGLSWCSVQGKVKVVQCYKCWGYGHRRQECDRNGEYEEACLKCGQKGHKAKDCTRCPIFDVFRGYLGYL